MGGCVRCLPDREPCWNVIPTGAGEWRGANAYVDAPQVLELEGKTPQEALLIKGGGRDGWVPTAAVLNLCLVRSYQNNSKWSNLWNVWATQFTLILWSLNQLQKLYNYIALSFCPSFLVFLRDKSNYSGHSPSLMQPQLFWHRAGLCTDTALDWVVEVCSVIAPNGSPNALWHTACVSYSQCAKVDAKLETNWVAGYWKKWPGRGMWFPLDLLAAEQEATLGVRLNQSATDNPEVVSEEKKALRGSRRIACSIDRSIIS